MPGDAPAVCRSCGNFVLPAWDVCPWCGRALAGTRGSGGPYPPRALDAFRSRAWRRTRTGLVLTAIGLLLSWIPFVAAIAAIFLSLGSTHLFLGARGVHRRHEVAVVLSFLLLTIGGVIVGILVGAFLLQGYEAAQQGQPLRVLREPASLLNWASLPATVVVVAGFALQVVHLIPPRRVRVLLLVCGLLLVGAIAATFLTDPQIASLDDRVARGALIADFLLRISLYRMIEAPAYIALAILYLEAYWDSALRTGDGLAGVTDKG